MKKTIFSFALSVALIAGMSLVASCSSDNDIVDEITTQQPAQGGQVISVEVGASIGEATKATYGDRDITLESGDALYVSLSNGTWTATGTLSYNGSYFSGDLTVTGGTYEGTNIFADATSAFDATLLPKDYATKAPGYLSATGEADASRAFCAETKGNAVPQVAHIIKTAYNSGTNTITLTAQNAVVFVTATGLTDGEQYLSFSDETAGTIVYGKVTASGGEATFAVGIPAATSHKYAVYCAAEGKSSAVTAAKSPTANKVHNLTAALTDTGILPGVCSVSSTKQVHFSKGSLKYDDDKWQFANNEFESSYSLKWNKDNGSTFFQWGVVLSPFDGYSHRELQSTITDDIGTEWRALIYDEWSYLLGLSGSRPATHKYALVSVNDNGGLLLFPDVFTWDVSSMGTEPTIYDTHLSGRAFSTNGKNYTTSEYAVIKAAGGVFLPAAGYYSASEGRWRENGVEGCYWSSTSQDGYYAYGLDFKNNTVSIIPMEKPFGITPARLVQDAN